MNRTALCIKMLNLLNSNELISRQDLADMLETNIRNIVEFKNELETAGYIIETVHGRYGGYRLHKERLFPNIAATSEEITSVNEALKYLKVHNFDDFKSFESAMIKLKAGFKDPLKSNEIYYFGDSVTSSADDRKMLRKIEKAKNEFSIVEFDYKPLNSKKGFERRRIEPYEIINNADGYYICAYDLTKNKKHTFKNFKIIDTRMHDLNVTNLTFKRDSEFKLNEYIGTNDFFKSALYCHLKINGIHGELIREKNIGINCKKSFNDGELDLEFYMENKVRLKEFILMLGSDAEVLAPVELKKEIIKEISDTLGKYHLGSML